MLCCIRSTAYAYLSNFVSTSFILSPSVGENPQFLSLFGLCHLVVSPIGSSLRELKMCAQLQTFPYPTASKSILYSNAFMAKLGTQSRTFKSVMNKQANRQTDKQKTQRFWPSRRWVKSEPNQTWHGDRGPRARSYALKTFGALTHNFAARGR